MESKNLAQFFLDIGGVFVEKPYEIPWYKGGRTELMYIMHLYTNIVREVNRKLNVSMTSHLLKFTTKDEPNIWIGLEDNEDVESMFLSNDNNIHLYVVMWEGDEDLQTPPNPIGSDDLYHIMRYSFIDFDLLFTNSWLFFFVLVEWQLLVQMLLHPQVKSTKKEACFMFHHQMH